MSKICDLCNIPISDTEMKVIPLSQMQHAVRKGWQPCKDAISLMANNFGLTDNELESHFYQHVMNDTSDWGLCRVCAEDFQKNIQRQSKPTTTSSANEMTLGVGLYSGAQQPGLFAGRWNRTKYFGAIFGIWVVAFIVMSLMFQEYEPGQENVLFVIVAVAQAVPVVKRLHDLDRPGSHYWLLLIPLYNMYLGLLLLFQRGTQGRNSFGPDPLD